MNTSTDQVTPPLEQMPHEFDSRQNQIIADLAAAMRWIGLPLMLIGLLYAVAAGMGLAQAFSRPELLVSVVFVVLATLFFFALGIWTRRAAESFQRITTTSGQDIVHLMDALNNLRKAYSLLSAIVKLYVALIIVSLILMLIVAIARAFQA
jgi:hypothetical protein